jgi:ABC-type Mn2+/Zn2+ transport system permease subunit
MKRMTFLSIALSEIAALGVALGLLIGFSPSFCAFAFSLGAVLFFWRKTGKNGADEESFIGFIYAASAALGIILISLNPLVESKGVDLVSGNLLYCTGEDLASIFMTTVIIGAVHFLCRRPFVYVAYDRETATAQGLRGGMWDALLLVSIGFVISFSIRLTGVLFVFGSLIIPALAALTLTRKVKNIFVCSVIFAVAGNIAGFLFSFYFDVPTSPAIVCCYAAGYIICSAVSSLSRRA